MQVDLDLGAQARNQVMPTIGVKGNDHGNTLTNLGEVAAGHIRRGQQGELARGRLNDVINMAGERITIVGIDGDVHILTIFDVVELTLVDISHNI